MGKKVGNTVHFRSGAGGDRNDPDYIAVGNRTKSSDTITKVFQHGVRTKNNGYINNKRIISYDTSSH